ncbi:MAG: NADP-dependent malic enzyme [Alphaproteobacteria bacterium]|nr:NADP-dependent malic enzyme [Alphaproteobacteria bacterium SS10]
MGDKLKDRALEYHRAQPAGKLALQPTKPLGNQSDLALAYSPGVAFACEAIVEDPSAASTYTSRGNLVAVVTNGTAVLGLGNIGPLASKPVMEGKAVLFKKFAGIDAIDIEVDAAEPDKFCDIVAALEPSFGAINLEDIKAPECFVVEEHLRKRMGIPVFHDDQHGTAIIVGAAVLNWSRLTKRKLEEVKVVTSGAGAAAIACLNLLVDMGVKLENITATDIDGVLHAERRDSLHEKQARFARETDHRTLSDAIGDADVFLGVSAPKVLKQEHVKAMAKEPLIMALANPTPEIMPEEVKEVRDDAYIATGRTDFPNQVNNVLCFPFIFRGALDVGATEINEAMKLACVEAIADLAMVEASEAVAAAYGDEAMGFGPQYLIPKPFDPRLVGRIAMAVAKAAMDSGVATRPIEDFDQYANELNRFMFKSGLVMTPVFSKAKQAPQRVAYAEGEDMRVLRAVQLAVDDGLAEPILIGRRSVVTDRIERLNLRIREGEHFELVDPESDPRFPEYWASYHKILERQGITPARAREAVRTNTTIIGSLMLRKGETDAMICGAKGGYRKQLHDVQSVIGLRKGQTIPAALSVLVTGSGTFFICDTQINEDPNAAQVAEMTIEAAEAVRQFGITPKVALLSFSNFGSRSGPSVEKMQEARRLLHEIAPDLEVEGEMHADLALQEDLRAQIFPNSHLTGAANLLVMPNLDAANIGYNLVKCLGDAQPIGPLLLGVDKPAHILTSSATARTILNVTALATVDAQQHSGGPAKQTQLFGV